MSDEQPPEDIPDAEPDAEETRLPLPPEREYGADQIKILEGLEAVRKRPGMYVPNTSLEGLHHLRLDAFVSVVVRGLGEGQGPLPDDGGRAGGLGAVRSGGGWRSR